MPIARSLAALLAASFAAAQSIPPLEFVPAFPSQPKFDRPLQIEFPPRDPEHAYVVEQTGRIWRIPREASAERTLWLDLSATCLHSGNGGHNEEGLLGLAFDPEAASAHAFVYYSEKTGEKPYKDRRGKDQVLILRRSVIARMQVVDDGARLDPASELRILEIEQPWGNHNGGTIVFGPDRMLYVALGDGGARADRGGNAQNLGTLLGAVLRIDVRGATAEQRYAIPADNPFVGREGARGEIWAYGLRNPWRIAFDRAAGDLWCGDVGQDLFEEVDRLVAGGNYGWPLREAFHEFPPGRDTEGDPTGLLDPVAEYPRSVGISVTGGYVYRGAKIPALVGRYVYGDFATMRVFGVREDREGGAHQVDELCKVRGPLASFGEEPDGELLALCFDGRIYRLAVAAE